MELIAFLSCVSVIAFAQEVSIEWIIQRIEDEKSSF